VLDERSGAPLSQVQVYIAGGYQGTLTARSGSFEIRDVPAGTYELRAERVGLTLGSREITVPEGGTAEVTFELSAQAIGLAEIRSDGSPGAPAPSTPPTRVRLREVPGGAVVFTPMTVHPQVANVAEVQEALRREYPATLRNAGIGGSVIVNLFVDADGRVQNKVIERSSRNDQLDQAALTIVNEMRFSPAQNRDQRVAVWVTLSLTFQP
jgi:TonB family protein